MVLGMTRCDVSNGTAWVNKKSHAIEILSAVMRGVESPIFKNAKIGEEC